MVALDLCRGGGLKNNAHGHEQHEQAGGKASEQAQRTAHSTRQKSTPFFCRSTSNNNRGPQLHNIHSIDGSSYTVDLDLHVPVKNE